MTGRRGGPRLLLGALGTLVVLGVFFGVTVPARAATFTVTTAADAGPGSLRQAILDANAMPNAGSVADVIDFAIGPATITLASDLPAVTEKVTIDGTTATGYTDRPVITLDGVGGTGLSIGAPETTVRALSFGGFDDAIAVGATAATITGNHLGVDAAGAAATPNTRGVTLGTGGDGATVSGNVVSGNVVGITVTASGAVITGNLVGTNRDGTAALGNTDVGIAVSGSSVDVRIGGTTAAARNIISGNGSGSSGAGIAVSEGLGSRLVVGNYIGTDAAGSAALGNFQGIHAFNSVVTVGGPAPGEGNVVSGNLTTGISVSTIDLGALGPGSVIQANTVGLAADGTAALGNGSAGIRLDGANHQVGGSSPGEGNVISSNNGHGIDASSADNLIVSGNLIGTDRSGTLARGNVATGVDASESEGTTIGGATAAAGNMIAANDLGIRAGTLATAEIRNNLVGTNALGAIGLGNTAGIEVDNSQAVTVSANVVASSTGAGLRLGESTDVTVTANRIGTDAADRPGLGNGTGIDVRSRTDGVQIGDDAGSTGLGNVIVNNGGTGVALVFNAGEPPPEATGVAILGNAIAGNGGLGIDLATPGVTPNDPGDPDVGPNEVQNQPVLTAAAFAGTTAVVSGTLNSTPSTGFVVEVLASETADPSGFGEGRTPAGRVNVTTDAAGNASFTVPNALHPPGQDVYTATATDVTTGSTSEFSNAVAAAAVTISTVASPGVPFGGSVSDTATVTGLNPAGTVVFRLYRAATDPTCAGSPVFTSAPVPLAGGAATSPSFSPTFPGTYLWIASYSGDAANPPVSGACGDPAESVTVAPAIPTLTTTAGAPSGGTIADTATLAAGFNITGTITFRLFGPDDPTCAGPPVFTDTTPVDGNGSYPSGAFAYTAAGVYNWIASYSGNENNAAVTGACGDPGESVTVPKGTPSIATTATPASATVGTPVRDMATVTGGLDPTGTVTFRLFSDPSCTVEVFSSTVPLTAGTATSGPFATAAPGTYQWIASYAGDADNEPATGACGDPGESVVVGPASPTLTTQASAPVTVGGAVTDTATLAGGVAPTGTMTFRLFGPTDATCAGTPVFTDTKPVSGNGPVTSSPFSPAAPGTYRWIAAYSGDANNTAVSGACNDPK